MTTPLKPEISVVETPARLGVCNCCGYEDEEHTVKHVKFHWRDRRAPQLGGGNAVALCRDCRKDVAVKLIESL